MRMRVPSTVISPHAAPRGSNVAYRLAVPLTDAAERKDQRITLSDGSTIDLKLPAGVEDGTQMRLGGKGEPGPGGPGDALITIQIQPHAYFTQDGDDLRLDLPITLTAGSDRMPVTWAFQPPAMFRMPSWVAEAVARMRGRTRFWTTVQSELTYMLLSR